jgi:hypothetical protein
LKLCQIPTVGFDGITGQACFDAEMIEIPFDQRIGCHRAMIAKQLDEDNARATALILDTPQGFR